MQFTDRPTKVNVSFVILNRIYWYKSSFWEKNRLANIPIPSIQTELYTPGQYTDLDNDSVFFIGLINAYFMSFI